MDFSFPLTDATRPDLNARYRLLAGEDSVLNDFAGTDLSCRRPELATHLFTESGTVEVGAGQLQFRETELLRADTGSEECDHHFLNRCQAPD